MTLCERVCFCVLVTCLWVCMYVCVHICNHICGEQRSNVGCSLLLSTLCFETGPLAEQETHQLTGRSGQQAIEIHIPPPLLLSGGVTRRIMPHPAVYVGSGDLNPGPLAWGAGSLMTELSPQPWMTSLFPHLFSCRSAAVPGKSRSPKRVQWMRREALH